VGTGEGPGSRGDIAAGRTARYCRKEEPGSRGRPGAEGARAAAGSSVVSEALGFLSFSIPFSFF